jgi:CMP-N-acetylneuraminic acid synthetase
MKDLSKVLFIIQARLNSERVPNKMLRPFGDTNLFSLSLDKVKQSDIPLEQFYVSVHEKKLKDIATEKGIQIYNRSYESSNEERDISILYEWWDKFPHYEYCILINSCNLFLEVDTINQFLHTFINSEHEGLFGVFPKKQYYWDKNGELVTKWVPETNVMNTKLVETIYEAAHSLYAGRLDLIGRGKWMGDPPYTMNNPALYTISEFEALDIDYEWQFDLYTSYWLKLNENKNNS